MSSTFDLITPEELIALDLIHDAAIYVREQWDVRMNRMEAQSNLDARAILFNASNHIFREHGCGISKAEIDGRHRLKIVPKSTPKTAAE